MKTVRRQLSFLAGATAVLAATAAVVVWLVLSNDARSPGVAATTAASPPVAQAPQTPPTPTPRMFGDTSVWNARLPADASIDPGSGQMIAALGSEVSDELAAHSGPDIGTTGTTTLYQVGPNQPTGRVQLSNPDLGWRVSLAKAFEAVPIPVNARPAQGSDAEMTIWQPSSDKLWEFFHMAKETDGWHADWGGAIQHVSQSPGYFTTSSWPGALSVWGATATSLPAAAGVITLDDVRRGQIDHALALELPSPRAGVWTWPAQRTDGTSSDPNSIPEGAILRLPPTLDLAALHLPRLTLLIARAAQQYGMIVRDQTHQAIGLFAENPLPLGTDVYYSHAVPRRSGPFQGQWPDELLSSFPWERLQVLTLHPCVRVGVPCER